jgi:hypothetical protein
MYMYAAASGIWIDGWEEYSEQSIERIVGHGERLLYMY